MVRSCRQQWHRLKLLCNACRVHLCGLMCQPLLPPMRSVDVVVHRIGCGCRRFPVGLAGEPPSEELRFGATGAHVELGAPLGASPDAFTTWIRVPLSAPPKPMVIALSGSGENTVSWELDAAAQPLVRWGGDQV